MRRRQIIRNGLVVGLATVAAAVAVSCTSDADWVAPAVAVGSPTAAASGDHPEPPHGRSAAEGDRRSAPAWEAVVRAGAAGVATIEEGRFAGAQLLRLGEVDPEVALFADRPQRLAGGLPVEEFLALWHVGAFGQDPPNAAVVLGGQLASVELARAVYEPSSATMAFVVVGLERTDGAAAPVLPVGEHGDATLFVDAVTGVVNQQVTDSVTQSNVKVIGTAPAVAMGQLYQRIAGSSGSTAQNESTDQQAVPRQQATTTAGVEQLYRADTETRPVPPVLASLVDAGQWSALTSD